MSCVYVLSILSATPARSIREASGTKLYTTMTSVVKFQFWVSKIRMVFAYKWPDLKEILIFFEMEQCRGDKSLSDFPDHFAVSKIDLDFWKLIFLHKD